MQPRLPQKTVQALSALLLLLLTACGPGNATPTVSVDAIYTAAYNTMMAAQATQLALTPPTSTPTQTSVPTLLPPPTAASLPTLAIGNPTQGSFNTGGGACDSSAFAGDVTIPDKTIMDAGKTFTKTWSLLNNGTCTWSTSYSLQFDSGDQMGGATVAMPSSVAPGSTVNISVKLTAPTTKGTYKGIWRLHNTAGQAFGDTPWVIIIVGQGATATSGPSPTAGPSPTPMPTSRGGFATISGKLVNVPDCGNVSLDISTSTATDPVFSVAGGACSYYFTVKDGWSGKVTPVRGAWTFSPSSRDYSNVTSDKSSQNYTGTPGSG